MISILNKSFRYTPSASTDVRKTWAKARREQAQADKKRAADSLEKIQKVRAIGSGR